MYPLNYIYNFQLFDVAVCFLLFRIQSTSEYYFWKNCMVKGHWINRTRLTEQYLLWILFIESNLLKSLIPLEFRCFFDLSHTSLQRIAFYFDKTRTSLRFNFCFSSIDLLNCFRRMKTDWILIAWKYHILNENINNE